MKLYILSFLLLLFSGAAAGQIIQGQIRTQDQQPVSGAVVKLLNTDQNSVTDSAGHYTLGPVKRGRYTLIVSAPGYAEKITSISLEQEWPALNIELSPQIIALDGIVVTAEKREQSLLTVPSAVTVLTGRKVTDTRTWSLNGLTALVPNYTYQELGVPFQQLQSIRGIQAFSENPAVATYIDDVNNLDILANGFALTDIERIEVLRGPQGTLFGRNAMGGVINIITRKPANKTEGMAEISLGNLQLQRFAAGLKVPLVANKLFFGIHGLFQSQEGYMKNDTTGTGATLSGINGRPVGGERSWYTNMYLKWLVAPRWNATLNVKTQRDASDQTGFFVSQRDYPRAIQNPDVINLSRIGKHNRTITNSSLSVKYGGASVSVTSISAFQTIGLSFANIDFPGYYHSFDGATVGSRLPPQQVWSQEIRVSSVQSARRLQYTAGVFGFLQTGYEPSTNTAYELTPGEAAFFGFSPGTFIISRNKSKNRGGALYGEISYQLTDRLKATAGIRYDRENRRANFNGFFDAYFFGGLVTELKPDTTAAGTYAAWSPKFSLQYGLNNRTHIYLTYTRGFRAGGVNTQRYPAGSGIRQTFDPEYSNNYEAGFKTVSADNRFRLLAAFYYIRWKNIQFFNLAAPFTFARGNLGNAVSAGIELESSFIPVRGLQLDASLGINDGRYGSFELKRAGGTVQLKDNRLSNAPSHTVFLAAQYSRALSSKTTGEIRLEWRQLGRFYTDVQNTLRQPTYSLLNARAGITRSHYSLYVWAQNLANTRFLAYGTQDTSFGTSVRMAAPATFGITITTKM